jgi:hypothetical protein
MNTNMGRVVPVLSLLLASMLSLSGCSERKPAPVTAPAPAPAPSAPAPTSSAPPVTPGTASDVNKKGTETGMVGGESGTVAASGKPGTGTSEGAGTGAAVSSDTKTEDKK